MTAEIDYVRRAATRGWDTSDSCAKHQVRLCWTNVDISSRLTPWLSLELELQPNLLATSLPALHPCWRKMTARRRLPVLKLWCVIHRPASGRVSLTDSTLRDLVEEKAAAEESRERLCNCRRYGQRNWQPGAIPAAYTSNCRSFPATGRGTRRQQRLWSCVGILPLLAVSSARFELTPDLPDSTRLARPTTGSSPYSPPRLT